MLPQLMGIVIDKVSVSTFAVGLGEKLGLSAEQIGLKAGMLVTALFPIFGCIVLIVIMRYGKKNAEKIFEQDKEELGKIAKYLLESEYASLSVNDAYSFYALGEDYAIIDSEISKAVIFSV